MQQQLAALAAEIADLVMRLGRAQAEAAQANARADAAEARLKEHEAAERERKPDTKGASL